MTTTGSTVRGLCPGRGGGTEIVSTYRLSEVIHEIHIFFFTHATRSKIYHIVSIKTRLTGHKKMVSKD